MSEIRLILRKVAAGAACLAERKAVIAVEPETISKNGVSPKNQRNRRIFLTIMLGVFFVGFIFSGCKKDKDNDVLTPEEKQAIISSYESFKPIADNILINEGTTAEFESIIPTIKSYPMVEDAWVDGDAFYVKFLKGGSVGWLKTEIPIDDEMETNIFEKNIKSSNTPSKKTACLINCVSGEASFSSVTSIFENLKNTLQTNGYSVVIKNAPSAGINFFKNDLKGYGIIFVVAHGIYDSRVNATFLVTGQKSQVNLKGLVGEELEWWKEGKLTLYSTKENPLIEYYAVSDKLFDFSYANSSSFPNSLIYLASCEGLKYDNLAKVLCKKGAGVVIGWTEANKIGHTTGKKMFDFMLQGKSVSEAYQALKPSDRQGSSGNQSLTYYPTSGGNMRLVEEQSAFLGKWDFCTSGLPCNWGEEKGISLKENSIAVFIDAINGTWNATGSSINIKFLYGSSSSEEYHSLTLNGTINSAKNQITGSIVASINAGGECTFSNKTGTFTMDKK